MPATSATALVIGAVVIGLERNFAMPHGTAVLIGQIKLTRIHVAPLLSPGCGSNKQKSHLFTMSKDPAARHPKVDEPPNLLSVATLFRRSELVEPIGIEPTT
jgi:hypothetical protein